MIDFSMKNPTSRDLETIVAQSNLYMDTQPQNQKHSLESSQSLRFEGNSDLFYNIVGQNNFDELEIRESFKRTSDTLQTDVLKVQA